MMSDIEMLRILENGNFETLFSASDLMSNQMIKNRIKDIPSEYFEPRINIDKESNTQISLIQFSLQTANLNTDQKKGLMEKYSIDPYDVKKLQTIIDSIKVAQEVGIVEEKQKNVNNNQDKAYGFSLASNDRLSRAYLLLIAYQCADSVNPLLDVQARLRADGVEDKYDAKTIVGLIEHANSLMEGRSEEERKAFYMQSISGVLDNATEIGTDKEIFDIEI